MYQIYPKLINKTKLLPKPNAAFVLMPFGPQMDEVYSEIKAALHSLGFQCTRADDLDANRPIMTNVVCEIITSHFVIADLTEKSANIFYEVGLAHAFRDITNVILISQSLDFVPFDLRHLPIIIYDRGNLRGLTTRLTKKVLDNRSYFAGQVRLREAYQQQLASEAEFEELFDFFNEQDHNCWDLVLQLFELSDSLSEHDLTYRVFLLRVEMSKLITAGRVRLFRNAFRVLRDVLCKYAGIAEIDQYIADVLRTSKYPEFRLDESDTLSFVIELALALFHHPQYKRRALEWLFTYLGRPKVAGIDLNRSKIEHFVLFSNDPEVFEFLIYSLANENHTLRETAADFLGEIGSVSAVPSLLVTLERETGPYVARSIFSALGKIGAPEGARGILGWISRNEETIAARQLDFVIRHADVALAKIDARNNTRYRSELATFQQLA